MKVSRPFHKAFKLQGNPFDSIEELLSFSKSFSFEITSFLTNWFDEKDVVEVKTSGSTGVPKIIRLSKKHMINSAKATGEYFNLFEGTSALLCMSPNYIAGKMMLVRALTLGWHLDFVAPVSNPLMNIKTNYDFSAMVPMQLHNSLNEIHKVKKLIIGGGVVSNELLEKIQNISTDVFATYGMTETITHIAVKKLNNVIASETKQSQSEIKTNSDCDSELVEESYYQLFPNIKISTDKRGCLVINAPNIADEEIITNDIVELISDFEFKWLGRFDTIINSGGIKLIPEQIEEKFSAVLSNRFFVTGIPDTILGEKLVLIVEGEEMNSIMNEIKKINSLSKFELPKEIYFVDNFIETPTKKINRAATLKLIKGTC